MAGDSGAIRSVMRAAAVISAISDTGRSGARLSDIVRMTGMSKTTVHRLLRTLCVIGWVEVDQDNVAYRLGLQLVEIGMVASDRHGISEVATPHLNRLSETFGDTVYLTVRVGTDAMCVDRSLGAYPIRTATTLIGERRILGSCAGSLALLAWSSEVDFDQLVPSLTARADRFGANSCSRAALHESIRRAKLLGYSQFTSTVMLGAQGVGVPVLDSASAAIAAISVEASSKRLAEPRKSRLVQSMKREAAALSNRLTCLDSGDEIALRQLLQRDLA